MKPRTSPDRDLAACLAIIAVVWQCTPKRDVAWFAQAFVAMTGLRLLGVGWPVAALPLVVLLVATLVPYMIIPFAVRSFHAKRRADR